MLVTSRNSYTPARRLMAPEIPCGKSNHHGIMLLLSTPGSVTVLEHLFASEPFWLRRYTLGSLYLQTRLRYAVIHH
jgi:hypothetical protein